MWIKINTNKAQHAYAHATYKAPDFFENFHGFTQTSQVLAPLNENISNLSNASFSESAGEIHDLLFALNRCSRYFTSFHNRTDNRHPTVPRTTGRCHSCATLHHIYPKEKHAKVRSVITTTSLGPVNAVSWRRVLLRGICRVVIELHPAVGRQ